MNKNPSEHGQAMVLILLALVGLLGFAALAVDMGQLYAARRKAQSAADAAALAAAYDAIAGSKDADAAVNQGYVLAGINGFNNDKETNWVFVNNPPIGGPYCGECGEPVAYEYYQVKITVRLKPILAQVVYKGAEETTVEAIAHAQTADTASSGDAIHSLSKTSDSMNFSGNITVHVDGGNIRSNGGMIKNGASGGVIVESPGHIYYAGGFSGHTSPLSPGPENDSAATIGASMPEPYCPSAAEAGGWISKSGVKYNQIDGVDYYYYPSGLSVETLPEGIHCIKGGIGKGNYSGSHVLIVLLTGGIQQTGNDSVNFRAAPDLIDANGTQWGGMVFYAPKSNTNELKFGGNSGAFFQGTIFAPGAQCDIGGTEDGSAEHAAFICNTFKFHGNPTTYIIYKPEELFHFPPFLELVQ